MAELKAVAAAQGVTVARLLRRAVREMVTGGPDLFDDGLKALSETARQLAAAGRNLNQIAATLNSGDHAYASDIRNAIAEMRIALDVAQDRYVSLIRGSRERWLTVAAAKRKAGD